MTKRRSRRNSDNIKRRVRVWWTRPAKDMLATLPPKIRRTLLDRTAALADTDPRAAHKRLTGPLHDYYSIRVSRYRALYKVEERQLANGDILVQVTVLVVAVGKRKEGDKRDIYKLAERLIRFAGSETDRQETGENK